MREKRDDDHSKTGLVRLRDFLGPGKLIPLGKSTWWAGIKAGRYPKPVRIGTRAVAWRVEDLQTLVERGIGS